MRTSRLIGIVVSTISCLSLLSLLLVSETAFGCDGDDPGMANPAAVYCHELGYEYKTVDAQGGQHGTCVFPDGSECEEWAFLEGACGQSYSYCARHGYDVVTKTDGKNPISSEYGVCVQGQQEVGPVTGLMELSEKSTRGSYPVEQAPTSAEQGGDLTGSLPSSFSWREWMTSVKNQGICGSCWAYSALGVVEAMYNIRGRGSNLDLSEEYLVSGSVARDEENNCCGGETDEALAYVRDSGVPDEACLPYVDGDAGGCSCATSSCGSNCTYRTGDECSDRRYSADRCTDWQSRSRKISDTGPVANNQEVIKQKLVTVGPLSISMCVGSTCGGYYDGDIFKCAGASDVDHGVIIVGYNDADGGYWIVKNSWGVGFQDQGYFKVGYGQCLIETSVLYANLPSGVGVVGGIAEPADVAQALAGESASSGASGPPYAALAGGAAAAVVVLGASVWHCRRRWLR
jgi:C1A family cysteine protease/putative hemolysin